MTEKTAYAKQLFIYGEGNDPPIRDLEKLSKKSGAAVRTLRDHVKDWRKEATALAVRSESSPYSLALSEGVLTQHAKEIEFLGEQVKKLRNKLSRLDPSQSSYHVVLGSYQSALTKWEKSSGIGTLRHSNGCDEGACTHLGTGERQERERSRITRGDR